MLQFTEISESLPVTVKLGSEALLKIESSTCSNLSAAEVGTIMMTPPSQPETFSNGSPYFNTNIIIKTSTVSGEPL